MNLTARRLAVLACHLVLLAPLGPAALAQDRGRTPAAESDRPLVVRGVVRGVVDAVTVYRGQALVSRRVDVPGPAGLREVVVTDLPARVLAGSVHAESSEGLVIRSVRYRDRPVMEDVRDEVRALDERIRALEDQLQEITNLRGVHEQQLAYLDRLENFTAQTANRELTEGTLNPDALRDTTVFLFEQRRELASRQLELQTRARNLEEQLNLLRRQRAELAGGSSRNAREAVVFVDVRNERGGTLDLRYVVDDATWNPSYNARADRDRTSVLLEYNAAIEQMSGEDWTDAALTLSTATPSLDAEAPDLHSLTLALARGTPAEPDAPAAEAPRRTAIFFRRGNRESSSNAGARTRNGRSNQWRETGSGGRP